MLKFEIKKLYKKKAFHITFFIALIWTLSLFLYSSYQEKNIVDIELSNLLNIDMFFEDNIRDLEWRQMVLDSSKKFDKELMLEDPEYKIDENKYAEEIEDIEKYNAHLTTIGNSLGKLKYEIGKENWGKVPHEYNTLYKAIDNLGDDYISRFEKIEMIATTEYLIDNNLEYINPDISTSIGPFVKRSLDIMFWFVGIFFLTILFGTSLSEEFEAETWPTIKKTPKSNLHILLSKLFSMILGALSFIFLILLFGGIVSLIKNGDLSSLNYPTFIKGKDFYISPYNDYLLVPIKSYILIKTMVFFNASLILYALMLLIGNFTNNLTNIVINLILVSSSYFLNKRYSFLQSFLNPLYCFNFEDLTAKLLLDFNILYILFNLIFVGIIIFILSKIGLKERKTLSIQAIKTRNKESKSNKIFGSITAFEIKKVFKKGYVKILAITLIVILSLAYISLSQGVKYIEDFYYSLLTNIINLRTDISVMPYLNKHIDDLEEVVKLDSKELQYVGSYPYNKDTAKISLDKHLELKDFYLMLLESNNEHLQAYKSKDWETFYDYQIYLLNVLFNSQDYSATEVPLFMGYTYPADTFEYEVSIKEKEILKELDTPPVLSNLFLNTIYDNPPNTPTGKMGWNNLWNRYGNTGLYSFYQFIELNFYLIPMIIIITLLGLGITTEFGKKKPIKFLLTQPIEAKNLFKGKLKTSLILSLTINLLIVIFILSIGSINVSLGDPSYPILRYESEIVSSAKDYTGYISQDHGYNFMPIIKFILQAEVLVILTTSFLLILTNILSFKFTNKLKLFISTVIIVVGGYLISINTLKNLGGFLPFTYFNIPKILNGEFSAIYNNPILNFKTGVIVLLVSNILLFVFGNYISEKIEISCQ